VNGYDGRTKILFKWSLLPRVTASLFVNADKFCMKFLHRVQKKSGTLVSGRNSC